MLKVRIIPTLLWKNHGLVKGVAFNSWRRVGTVMPAVKVYNSRDVDELIIVDIMASQDASQPDYDSIADFSSECFVPLTMGGGVKSRDDIRRLLRSGADKVAINSAAYDTPALIDEAARFFGAQCVVASIDARRMEDGQYRCFSHSGSKMREQTPLQWARELVERGAGEILLTSIDRDGTMQGYDLALVEQICHAVNVPVIASGGAGAYQHMLEVIRNAGASAVAAASMFHFTEQTPAAAKKYLAAAGVPVRANYRP